MENEVVREENVKLKVIKKSLNKKLKILIVLLLCIAAVVIGLRNVNLFKSKTTKLGFEDIGELATQTAYCTKLNEIENSRSLFGVTIPFTQSKYIYSYDLVIKAGFDFKEIEWDEEDNKIEVKLPKAKVLSTEIDFDSFKVYHEDESIFNQIHLEENNEALKDLKEKAEEDAVNNGLLDNARSNAETILKGFFANGYDLDKYEIVFIDK